MAESGLFAHAYLGITGAHTTHPARDLADQDRIDDRGVENPRNFFEEK